MITKYDNVNNFIALSEDMGFLASLSSEQAELYSVRRFLQVQGAAYRRQHVDTLLLDFYDTTISGEDNPYTRRVSFNRCEFIFDESPAIFPNDGVVEIQNSTGWLIIANSHNIEIKIYNCPELFLEIWHSDVTIQIEHCEFTERFRGIELKNSIVRGNFQCINVWANVSLIRATIKADELKIRNSSVNWTTVEGKIIR